MITAEQFDTVAGQFVFELISQRLLKVPNLVDDVVFSRMDARLRVAAQAHQGA